MIFVRRRISKTKKTVTTNYTATEYDYDDISDGASSAAGYAVGKLASNTGTGESVYSSDDTTTGYVFYSFGNVSIPTDATNVSISCAVKGGREHSSKGKLEAQMLWLKTSGAIHFGDKMTFTSTTSSVKTVSIDNETLYALANPRGFTERDIALNAALDVMVGFYGGHIDGITYTVSYDIYE